ncbi:AMP-binding protein [Massilia sp. H-1]|nr:AMP-binding protein [Massilia sp. H-1]
MAALVVHTSGSTGAPQAIPKRLSQMTAEVATLELLFGAAIGDADIIATVSHQHIYGLLFKVLWPLAAGRAIHAVSLAYPEQLAAALALRPCVLVASPAHLKRLPEHLDWRGAQAMLRAVFSSGGPLAPDAAVAIGLPAGLHADRNLRQQRNRRGGLALRPAVVERRVGSHAWRQVAQRRGRGHARSSLRAPGQRRLAAPGRPGRTRGREPLPAAGARRPSGQDRRKTHFARRHRSGPAGRSGLAREARVALCHEVAGERQALAAFVVLTPEGRALLDAHGKSAMNRRLRASLAGVVEAVALPRRWRYLDQMPINAQGKTPQALLLSLLGDAAAPRPAPPHTTLLERDGACCCCR